MSFGLGKTKPPLVAQTPKNGTLIGRMKVGLEQQVAESDLALDSFINQAGVVADKLRELADIHYLPINGNPFAQQAYDMYIGIANSLDSTGIRDIPANFADLFTPFRERLKS